MGKTVPRGVRITNHVLGPLVTDAFVRLWCRSMQKLYQTMKKMIFEAIIPKCAKAIS
jgi:hypothetical protein